MKPRGLVLVALVGLIVTVLFAAVATAQSDLQDAQSGDLLLPTNTTGEFDTGNKEMSVHKPGQTDTNSSQQTLDPQAKQPRERRDRNNKDGAAPAQPAPSGGNSTNPGGAGGSNGGGNSGSTGGKAALTGSSGGALKELPRTGGPGM
jgi:hypothetical protein